MADFYNSPQDSIDFLIQINLIIKWCRNKRKYFGELETYLYKAKLLFWLAFSDKDFKNVQTEVLSK